MEQQEYIEKLKERIAYLEMKENMYANVQQELDNARKLLSDVGQTTGLWTCACILIISRCAVDHLMRTPDQMNMCVAQSRIV
jgi:hypothetical protein